MEGACVDVGSYCTQHFTKVVQRYDAPSTVVYKVYNTLINNMYDFLYFFVGVPSTHTTYFLQYRCFVLVLRFFTSSSFYLLSMSPPLPISTAKPTPVAPQPTAAGFRRVPTIATTVAVFSIAVFVQITQCFIVRQIITPHSFPLVPGVVRPCP
jgi:hypothetical protein